MVSFVSKKWGNGDSEANLSASLYNNDILGFITHTESNVTLSNNNNSPTSATVIQVCNSVTPKRRLEKQDLVAVNIVTSCPDLLFILLLIYNLT